MPRGVPKAKVQAPIESSQSSAQPTPVSSETSASAVSIPVQPTSPVPTAVLPAAVPVPPKVQIPAPAPSSTPPARVVTANPTATPAVAVIPIKCNNCVAHGQVGNAFIDPTTNRYSCFTCGSNGVAVIEAQSAPPILPPAPGYACPKCGGTRVAQTSPTGNYSCGNKSCLHSWVFGAEEASLVSSRPAQIDTTNLAHGGTSNVSTALGQGGGSKR